LEARIDFEEDEIPPQDIGPELERTKTRLVHLLADADRGILVRQGVRVAIVGRPNVGKSSLLNRLLRASRAIVTEIPGTTRDTLEETLNLQGIPVVLVDTAGIVEHTQDPIERLGIERSRAALAQAEMALLVVDVSQTLTEADRAIAALIQDKPVIVVQNKVDLRQESPARWAPGQQEPPALLDARCVPISALTGQGLGSLEDAIVDMVWSGRVSASEAPLVTSPRHKEALSRALDHVDAAQSSHKAGAWPDLIAIDVTAAVNALGEITGQTASEDLIETIFANFCIGK
jgi:tRNA modification GTPase